MMVSRVCHTHIAEPILFTFWGKMKNSATVQLRCCTAIWWSSNNTIAIVSFLSLLLAVVIHHTTLSYPSSRYRFLMLTKLNTKQSRQPVFVHNLKWYVHTQHTAAGRRSMAVACIYGTFWPHKHRTQYRGRKNNAPCRRRRHRHEIL